MIVITVFLLSTFFIWANGFNYSCPTGQVLAIVKQDDKEIDMNAVEVTLCGEKRTCIYSQGAACLNKGQYVSAVGESNGKVVVGCCQFSPPVQDHQGDDCHELVIETGASRPVSVPRPSPIPLGHKPAAPPGGGGGGGGGGGAAPPEEVVLELKSSGPGQPNQLVKSIKKLTGNGYSVTACSPQCGRSTSTTRRSSSTKTGPTTQKPHSGEKQKSQEKPHVKKKGLFSGQHCFSGDMTVVTPSGTKRMDEIRAGDQVLVTYAESEPVYEPIEWLYHRDPEAEVDFVTVTTESGRGLQLSANHLITIVPCSDADLKSAGVDELVDSRSFFARRLKLGHCVVALVDGEFVAERVVSIVRERKRGIYSPITSRGTVVVNELYVSCYSSVENHLIQKTVHSALINARRALSGVWSSIFGAPLAREDSNVPVPLKIMLKMAELVAPSDVFNSN